MRKRLVLRTCASDMTSYGGFQWPVSGPVEAPDWNPEPVCGGGLHGFLGGEGYGGLADWDTEAKWLIVEVSETDLVELQGGVKFPRGEVVHVGDQVSATQYLQSRGLRGAIIGAVATAGPGCTAIAGYRGTATAGNWGTAIAGHGGTAIAGRFGTATVGDGGTAAAGNGGQIRIRYWDHRPRTKIGYVGEDGIEPNTPYKVENGEFVKWTHKTTTK